MNKYAGETIMSIAYGLSVQPENDPYIQTAEKAIPQFARAAVPGTFLVDSLPWLKYLPEWVPGAGFQRLAREWRGLARDMVVVQYDAALKIIVSLYAMLDLRPLITVMVG